MGVEIERKFLVDNEQWKQLVKPVGKHYRQGYILSETTKTIRVRITDEFGYITIKGVTQGFSRKEYEYVIPVNEGAELLDNFAVSELEKVRYCINFDGKVWEVDEFLGDNQGLLVAEIELEYETETFKLPAWVTIEVTGDDKYYNSNLSIKPFNKWNG